MKKSSLLGIGITWIVALIVGVLSAAIDWMPEQAGGFSEDVDWLFYFIYIINVLFFLLIGALMITFAIAGRQKKEDRGTVVHGATHNTLIEIVWSTPPLLIVLAIFVWGFRGYTDMAEMPPLNADAYVVDVVGSQWSWKFTHENGAMVAGKNNDAVLDIPAGRPVEFRLSATDVLHSLFLPAQRAKKDAVPGRYNRMWVEVPVAIIEKTLEEQDKPAGERYVDYPIHCTEYCGLEHSQMNGILRVWHPDDWEARLVDMKGWNKTNETPIAWGEQVHSKFGGCASCHSVDSSAGIGPTWKDLWGQPRGDGVVDEQYILESIYKPNAVKAPGFEGVAMPSSAGTLNYGDVLGVIAYIQSLSGVSEDQIRSEFPADRKVFDGTTWLDENNQVTDPPALD